MSPRDPILYHNRLTGETEAEAIYGETALRWCYESPLGRAALHAFVKRPFFSRFHGWRMSRPASRKRIAPFIRDYGLDPSEFAETPGDFGSFNDFFSRRLRPGARPIADSPAVFPADGRHLGFPEASAIGSVFLKGQRFDLPALLGSQELARKYARGSLLVSRLCPTDYHRFHFPASGVPGQPRLINGSLFSVSPVALRQNLSYFWQNKRALTELRTESLGTILILEIGATCVGSIRQTYAPGKPVAKGQEKGFFSFGGSSVITLFEPGSISLAQDLLRHSARQRELYTLMGDSLTSAPDARATHSARK